MIPLLFIFGFIAAYILGGRKIAIPYGIALTQSMWLTITLTVILDILEIPLFYFIYGKGRRMKALKNAKIDSKSHKERIKRYEVWHWAKELGTPGIFIISLLPSFGGGIWSSVLLAFMLKTEKKLAYFLIIAGSIVGTMFIAFFTHGIINFIKIIF
nr:hypothetical protein [uncultured archaeon]